MCKPTAAPEEGSGGTTCRYKPASAGAPFVEITVDWGAGNVGMMSTGLLARIEPGISDPLTGIGDQAAAIGPRLMIRTGEDLLTLTLWGVDDSVASARRIVDTMRPRMGPTSQSQGASSDARAGASPAVPDEAKEALGRVLSALGAQAAASPNDAASNGGNAAVASAAANGGAATSRAEPVFPPAAGSAWP